MVAIMSAGTPRVTIRIDDELREEIEIVITDRNSRTRDRPWTLSDFIGIAIREKVLKMQRGRSTGQIGSPERLKDYDIGR
jgi:metal-responsive CopG/Arc/MetJ family transcriptional regulator